jgi:hypothetical protein
VKSKTLPKESVIFDEAFDSDNSLEIKLSKTSGDKNIPFNDKEDNYSTDSACEDLEIQKVIKVEMIKKENQKSENDDIDEEENSDYDENEESESEVCGSGEEKGDNYDEDDGDDVDDDERIEKKKVENEDEEKKDFYFLKFKNNLENCCFANSGIQLFMACGKDFFDTLYTNCNDNLNKNPFCVIFKEYNELSKAHDMSEISSFSLREYAMRENTDTKDSYINNSEQDCFGFILHLLSLTCKEIKSLFRLSVEEKNICTKCKNEIFFKRSDSSYISVSRNFEKEMDFVKLFEPKTHRINCVKCGCQTQSKKTKYTALGNFFLLRISSENYTARLNTKIANVNLNNVIQIPNIQGNFLCKAAIIHIPKSYIKSNSGGHYTCYKRIQNPNFQWLNISDSAAKPEKTLPENLKDVYLMLFEKCI